MAPVSVVFNPDLDLILIDVDLDGPWCRRTYVFALDTACSETLVRHEALVDLGYQARDGEETATVTTAIGQERGYFLRVAQMTALGHTRKEFRVSAQDLPEDTGIDGLLGLNFLRQFNYEIRSREGRILVEPA